ncbi:uncharacterized protein K460DRAFT_371759 [Cucurbitaria berberidis CBS 394.84]|uniref:Uncharacterized protein n=1 Tax=Cucurbitaria berberidis CBS 394.84 TaxID=1168544 RepID=A0A9P4G7N9_9PLEO|nr:uncharacterized protein K460DRAFT_371759 [Cucurbitaria berberidis CBS 394.84]KAF1840557.1 hypothetical protein K460DRAFT_371759 [Cucurbitaria berberidis CBS 394.84]
MVKYRDHALLALGCKLLSSLTVFTAALVRNPTTRTLRPPVKIRLRQGFCYADELW